MKITERVSAFCLILSIMIIGTFAINNINASESIDDNDSNLESYFIDFIPDYMQPGSKIEFIADNKFIVIEGDVSENTFIAPSNDSNYPPEVYVEEYPDPIKGMIVTYADDGLINKIIYPEGVEDPLLQEKTQIWKIKYLDNSSASDLKTFGPQLSSGFYSTTSLVVWLVFKTVQRYL